jgi:hypothetical protein
MRSNAAPDNPSSDVICSADIIPGMSIPEWPEPAVGAGLPKLASRSVI